jgi:hypothetical protein
VTEQYAVNVNMFLKKGRNPNHKSAKPGGNIAFCGYLKGEDGNDYFARWYLD